MGVLFIWSSNLSRLNWNVVTICFHFLFQSLLLPCPLTDWPIWLLACFSDFLSFFIIAVGFTSLRGGTPGKSSFSRRGGKVFLIPFFFPESHFSEYTSVVRFSFCFLLFLRTQILRDQIRLEKLPRPPVDPSRSHLNKPDRSSPFNSVDQIPLAWRGLRTLSRILTGVVLLRGVCALSDVLPFVYIAPNSCSSHSRSSFDG